MIRVNKVMVNWVETTEVMLEPYEWDEADDIEEIVELKVIKVSQEVMPYLFYYDFCLNDFAEFFNNNDPILAFSDGEHVIAIEFNNECSVLSKSVLLYKDRERVINQLYNEPLQVLTLTNLITLEHKEFGLTRKEREKKTYLYNKLDILYVCKDDQLKLLYQVCFLKASDDYQAMYDAFIELIDSGYDQVHETIYRMLASGL